MSPNNFSKSENLMRCHDIVPWFRGMPFDMPRLLDQLEPRLPDLFSSDAVLPSLIYTGDRRCRSKNTIGAIWWNSETVPHGASGPAIYPGPCSGCRQRRSTLRILTTK